MEGPYPRFRGTDSTCVEPPVLGEGERDRPLSPISGGDSAASGAPSIGGKGGNTPCIGGPARRRRAGGHAWEHRPGVGAPALLEGYRRSWRCWLIGGPAAVDDLSICATERLVGVHIRADLQMETVQRRWQHAIGGAAWRIRRAIPRSPSAAGGQFRRWRGGVPAAGNARGWPMRALPRRWPAALRRLRRHRPLRGIPPCSGCGGRGEVPCYCGDASSPRT